MGTYSGGSGTELAPYQIGTKADLVELQATNADWGDYFLQTADIDMTDQDGWDSIGDSVSDSFDGQYDGDYYKISNLSGTTHMGLFGVVSGSLAIKNLILDNFDMEITSNLSSRAYGSLFIGNIGTSTIEIEEIAIINSTLTVNGDEDIDFIGLMCGINSGAVDSISKCFVSDSDLVISQVASGSANYGLFMGGRNGGTPIDCYAQGTITINDSDIFHVGGFTGQPYDTTERNYCVVDFDGSVSKSDGGFSDGYQTGPDDDSFFDSTVAGFTSTQTGTAKTTTQMQTESTFTNYDFTNTWEMGDSGYPELQWYTSISPSGGGLADQKTISLGIKLGL